MPKLKKKVIHFGWPFLIFIYLESKFKNEKNN